MIRSFWLCACLASAVLSFYCFRGAASELYHRAGLSEAQRQPSSTVAHRAFGLAARLSPWTSERWVWVAHSDAARGDFPGMLQSSREAIRWAPADARLWMYHLQQLAFSIPKGPELKTTLERVQTLSPASQSMHLAKALLGIQIWSLASYDFRQETIRSAQFVLENNPALLYRGLTRSRTEPLACSFVGSQLNLEKWCQTITALRKRCDNPGLDDKSLNWCKTQGLRP